jgi:hypothetical protein
VRRTLASLHLLVLACAAPVLLAACACRPACGPRPVDPAGVVVAEAEAARFDAPAPPAATLRIYDVRDLVAPPRAGTDALVAEIRARVDPAAWSRSDAALESRGDVVIARASPATHARIEAYLLDARTARERR